jgi:hypothetical protein
MLAAVIRKIREREERTALLRARIEQAAQQLWAETAMFSSTSAIQSHPLFDELMNMGSATTGYVVDRLKQNDIRLLWFLLLKRIERADPVEAHSKGDLRKMASAWIAWHKRSSLPEWKGDTLRLVA